MAADLPPPSREVRANARNMLGGDGLFLYLLKGYQEQITIRERRLASADLVTDTGRLAALKMQGELIGLKAAINAVFMLAEEEFKQDD